jgi:hypothetical protein
MQVNHFVFLGIQGGEQEENGRCPFHRLLLKFLQGEWAAIQWFRSCCHRALVPLQRFKKGMIATIWVCGSIGMIFKASHVLLQSCTRKPDGGYAPCPAR